MKHKQITLKWSFDIEPQTILWLEPMIPDFYDYGYTCGMLVYITDHRESLSCCTLTRELVFFLADMAFRMSE